MKVTQYLWPALFLTGSSWTSEWTRARAWVALQGEVDETSSCIDIVIISRLFCGLVIRGPRDDTLDYMPHMFLHQ